MFNPYKIRQDMKSIITNYRYWVLTLLGFIIIFGLVAVPQDGIGFWKYAILLFGSKLAALMALIAYCLLYIHWQDMGEIPELTDYINEE